MEGFVANTIETTVGELIEALSEVAANEPTGASFQLEMVALALENIMRRSHDSSRIIAALNEA